MLCRLFVAMLPSFFQWPSCVDHALHQNLPRQPVVAILVPFSLCGWAPGEMAMRIDPESGSDADGADADSETSVDSPSPGATA
eukprot:13978771-Alexandrium_andersonii.AAC.1